MDFLKKALDISDKIGELQTAAQKCDYMLEPICSSYGEIYVKSNEQKASLWDKSESAINIAQDYLREAIICADQAGELSNQLLQYLKKPYETDENSYLEDSILEMLKKADERKLRLVYVHVKALIGVA